MKFCDWIQHFWERFFSLTSQEIFLLNPNTGNCPIFRCGRDAEIAKRIYQSLSILIKDGAIEENPWNITFQRMLDMSVDSNLFLTKEELEKKGCTLSRNIFEGANTTFLPLYEAKMLHHFDHRFGDYQDKPEDSESTALPNIPVDRLANPNYTVLPRYWIDSQEVEERLIKVDRTGKILWQWCHQWLLGWRDITNATNERTVVASIIPRVAANDKFLLMLAESKRVYGLYGMLTSFIFDFVARQKLGSTSLKYFVMKQLPVLPPASFDIWIDSYGLCWGDWILPRILELTYTAWDLQPLAQDCGYDGAPFRWDEERRFLLRCELDAAYFHLYGIQRDDVDYIMETFPIVKRKDEQKHGHYRTKDKILEIYDAMAEAMKTRQPYQTLLDPPPADPSIAHSPQAR